MPEWGLGGAGGGGLNRPLWMAILICILAAATFLLTGGQLGCLRWPHAYQRRVAAHHGDTQHTELAKDGDMDEKEGQKKPLFERVASFGLLSAPVTPFAAEKLKHTIHSSVVRARRLAHPFLHVETELDESMGNDSDILNASALGSAAARLIISPFTSASRRAATAGAGYAMADDPLTPMTAVNFGIAKQRRARANAHIRGRLDKVVATDELAATFTVNACSWNVDQRPPPAYSTHLLTWLLGKTLANKLEHYHALRQEITAAHAVPLKSPPPETAASTTLRPQGRLPARRVSESVPQLAPVHGRFTAADHDHGVGDSLSSTARRTGKAAVLFGSLLQQFPDLLIITLQEVDMGGVALVKESTTSSVAWTDAILESLHVASDRQLYYKRIKVVQLVGLMLIVLVQARHVDYISHVRLSLTRTGAMRVLGNKGSVAMRATIYGKRFLFITAHFAAHKCNEEKRMFNYHAALDDLRFEMPAFTDDESEVLRTFATANESTASLIDSFVKGRSAWDRLFRVFERPSSMNAEARVLDEHDYIFFLGDLNSRLYGLGSADIRQSVEDNCFDHLLIHDELRQGMVYGDTFDGFEEQWINFPPTYKFDRGTSTYDTSRKKRDPAWCDRVLFRVLNPSAPADGGVPACELTADWSASPLSLTSSPDVPHSGVGWVALGDITNLGNEGLTPPVSEPDTSRTPRDDRLSRKTTRGKSGRKNKKAAAASSRGGAATTAVTSRSTMSTAIGSPSNSGSSSTTPTPPSSLHLKDAPSTSARAGSSVLTASMIQESTTARLPLPEPVAGSMTLSNISSCYIPPSHPVWQTKHCAETFKAARRPFTPGETALRFPMIPNHINPLEYFSVGELKQSDHRPICARFEVKVIMLSPSLVMGMLEDIQQVMDAEDSEGVSDSTKPAPSSSHSPPLQSSPRQRSAASSTARKSARASPSPHAAYHPCFPSVPASTVKSRCKVKESVE